MASMQSGYRRALLAKSEIAECTYTCFTLIVNILGLVLGFLMVVNPLFSFLTAGYLIGAYLLFLGIDSLVFALNLLCTRR